MGFGVGPFGHVPFGDWAWAKEILWDLLPPLYRDSDTSGWLEEYFNTLRPQFNAFRRQIRDLDANKDAYRARTQYSEVTRLKLGPQKVVLGERLMRGIDGSVLTAGAFTAPTARFTAEHRGALLQLRGSAVEANNRQFTIVSVVNRNSVVTFPVVSLDSDPLRWEVYQSGTSSDTTTLQVQSGDVSSFGVGWLVSDGYADYTIEARRQFNSTIPLMDRYGVDGTVFSGNFFSTLGMFRTEDLGKKVSIKGATVSGLDGLYEIYGVVSGTELVLADLEGVVQVLPTHTAALEWCLRPLPEIDVTGLVLPRGTVEDSGVDLVTAVSTTVTAASAPFEITDVGKKIEIRNSILGNNGVYEILSFISASAVVIDSTLVVETDLAWSVRIATSLGDGTYVDVRAPAILPYLAAEFGLIIDEQEVEWRQRMWVATVSRWVGQKGTAASYRIVGAISGFSVVTRPAYRITVPLASLVPSTNLLETGVSDAGHNGSDGSLLFTGGVWTFTASTAEFNAQDVTRALLIAGANTSANNRRYAIGTITSATTVQLAVGESFVAPEGNNGALIWEVTRLYTDLAPMLPLVDESNVDLLHEIVNTESAGALDFLIDKYCWESDWSSTVPVSVTAVVALGAGRYELTITHRTLTPFLTAPEVVVAIGRWKITYAGVEYFLETVPVQSSSGPPPEYTFEVYATSVPATGDANFELECDAQFSCGYCGASVLWAEATLGELATETGFAQERMWQRLATRLEEVTPAHVELILVRIMELEATLALAAELDVLGPVAASLYAPLSVYADDIAADLYPADVALRAELEAPAHMATFRGVGSMSVTGRT